MSILFAIRIFTDLCFYAFAMASLFTLPNHSGMLITSPLIVAFAAYFVPLAMKKWPGKWKMHCLPLILCLPAFIFTRYGSDVIVTVPMIAYLFYVIFRNNAYADYDGTLARFFLCLKLIPIPAFLGIISSNKNGFLEVMLPYFFFYLILNFMMLRMLRHNDKILSDRRFRIMNVTEMGLLCGFGYLLSSGLFMSILRFIGRMLIKYVFDPLITALAYVFGGVVWVLNKLFGWIDLFPEGVDVSQLDNGTGMTEGEAAVWEMYGEMAEENTNTQLLAYIAIGVGAVLLIVLLIFLFRALMKAGRRKEDNQFADVRESISEKNGPGRERLGLSYRDRVRQLYRKFLKMAYKMGVDPYENLNSREINDQVSHRLNRPALKGLRGVYIRARYSSGEITKEDLKAAKEAFDSLEKPE